MKRKTKKVTENIKSYQAEFKQKLEQTVATVIDKLVANDSETRTRLVRVAKTNLGTFAQTQFELRQALM